MADVVLENPIPQNETNTMEQQERVIGAMEVSDARADEPEIDYPTGFKFYNLWAVVTLSCIILGLDLGIVSVAIPAITDEFKTIADIGWYSAASRLTLCAFQFMFSKLFALFPIKWMFLISLAIFELGSLVSASAAKSHILVLGRAIIGMGAAGLIAGTFAILTKTVPIRKRGTYGALFGVAEVGASIAGPALGGVITERASWRWCFYINIPIGAIVFLGILIFFQELSPNLDTQLPLKQKLAKLDLLGTAVFVPGITAAMLALQWGGTTYGWGNVRIISLFLVFAVLILFFAYLQKRAGDNATLPGRIIGNRSILAGMLFTLCLSGSMSVITYYIPIFLQTVKQFSPSQSGVLILPSAVGLIIGCLIGGPGTSKIGYYVPFMLAAGCLTPVAAGLLMTLKVGTDLAQIISYQFLLGMSVGVGTQAPQIAASTVLKRKDATMGLAVIIFAQNFGPAFFIAVAQTIFTNRLSADLKEYAPGLNTTDFKSTGLSGLGNQLDKQHLAEVLMSYDKAINQVYALGLALACVSILGAVSIEWRSVKKKTT